MQAKNQAKEKLRYEVGDLLKLIPQEMTGRYDIVIDKGTLDAILPEDKPDNIKEIQEVYFENIKKMMRSESFSSYVVISMLQSFILKAILTTFLADKHFIVRIH